MKIEFNISTHKFPHVHIFCKLFEICLIQDMSEANMWVKQSFCRRINCRHARQITKDVYECRSFILCGSRSDFLTDLSYFAALVIWIQKNIFDWKICIH